MRPRLGENSRRLGRRGNQQVVDLPPGGVVSDRDACVQDEPEGARASAVVGHGRRQHDAIGDGDVLVLDRPHAGDQQRRLDDVAEGVLGCQARNGLAAGISDWPAEIDDTAWTTAAGLAMYSARLKVQGELERQSVGLLARILR